MPEYFSDGVRVENFQSLTIDDLGARQAQNSSGSAIALSNGSGVSITNSRALPGTRVFLRLDKVTRRRVFVNYDLKGAALAIKPASQRFYTQIGARKQSSNCKALTGGPGEGREEEAMNEIDLKDRRAVVTGGAQEIGCAIAQRLVASGAAVSVWDVDAKLAVSAAEELSKHGVAQGIGMDVTSPAKWRRR